MGHTGCVSISHRILFLSRDLESQCGNQAIMHLSINVGTVYGHCNLSHMYNVSHMHSHIVSDESCRVHSPQRTMYTVHWKRSTYSTSHKQCVVSFENVHEYTK